MYNGYKQISLEKPRVRIYTDTIWQILVLQNCSFEWKKTKYGRKAASKREDGTWGASQRGESPHYVQARNPSTARSGRLSLLGYPPHALPLTLTPATSQPSGRMPLANSGLGADAPSTRTRWPLWQTHDHIFLAPTRVTSSRDAAQLPGDAYILLYIRCVVFLGRDYGLNTWRRISASSMSLWHSWDFGAFHVSPTWRINKRKWREGARHLYLYICIGLIMTVLQIYRWKCNRFQTKLRSYGALQQNTTKILKTCMSLR